MEKLECKTGEKHVFSLVYASAYFLSTLFQKGISGIFIIVRKILSYWRLY